LLVHLFLRIDDRVDHLLRIAVNRRQVHREIYLRRLRRAGDVHQAVYADVVARERTAYAQVAQRHPLFGFLFLFLLLLFDAEEIAEAVEVFLHDEAETLRVQTVARKIAVVGLIVHAYGEVAVREDEVAEVKIADETLRGIRIVAITELAIEKQAVVEQWLCSCSTMSTQVQKLKNFKELRDNSLLA
jgi:hypothetical protein